MGARNQFRAVERARRGDERLDDIARGFRIARQPAVLETPACRDPAGIGLVRTHILRVAQPVDRATQMGAVIMLGLAGCAHHVLHHKMQVASLPGFVAQRKMQQR